MNIIKIIIEKSSDSYGAYAENVNGIYAAGNTIDEIKQSVNDAIETIKTFESNEIPDILKKDYKLVFSFDTQSFLEYYEGVFTRASLSRLTGINERQLGHYIQGKRKPRKDKALKIETALHGLAKELLSVELT